MCYNIVCHFFIPQALKIGPVQLQSSALLFIHGDDISCVPNNLYLAESGFILLTEVYVIRGVHIIV